MNVCDAEEKTNRFHRHRGYSLGYMHVYIYQIQVQQQTLSFSATKISQRNSNIVLFGIIVAKW